MKVLLCGGVDADELHAWQRALAGLMPEVEWLDPARAALARDEVVAAVVANPPPGSLQGLPRLKLIQSLWAGVDRLLGDPTLPPGVPIARMVDPVMNEAMAETALWATLALHRGFFGNARAQPERRWIQQPQRRAGAVQVLVLGFGQMGRAVAQRLATQGYRVSAWHSGTRPDVPAQPGIEALCGDAALHAALPRAEVLINLLPLTPTTRDLLDARLFARLPRGAGVVNLGRGAHLVDADLIEALDRGQLAHAVLDVFRTEPLPPDHPFWRHPRVTVLPHVAAQTDIGSAAEVAAANLRALGEGRPLSHLVERRRGY